MKFITLEEADKLDKKAVTKLYKNHFNPALYKSLKSLNSKMAMELMITDIIFKMLKDLKNTYERK